MMTLSVLVKKQREKREKLLLIGNSLSIQQRKPVKHHTSDEEYQINKYTFNAVMKAVNPYYDTNKVHQVP